VRDVRRARDYPVHHAEFDVGRDWITLRGTLANGRIALLGL
jgi:hypothetical protein